MWDVDPEIIFTFAVPVLKYTANALRMASLALPLMGGWVTEIEKCVSLIFFIDSFFADGLA
jgi:hypothetical protein